MALPEALGSAGSASARHPIDQSTPWTESVQWLPNHSRQER
jgi:hypothetical protein